MSIKHFILCAATVFCTHHASAATFSECQGVVTKVDDTVLGYPGNSGGVLVVSINGAQCGEAKFWFDDDALQTKNILALALMAMATGKQVSVAYDLDLALYNSRGKIHRIALQN